MVIDMHDVSSSIQQKSTHTAIDLFSGAGGLTEGLKQADFKVVGAVEYEKTACETYVKNHPEVNLQRKDIKSLDPTVFMEELGLKKGKLDLLAGCPPCQGFSTIGTRNGNKKGDDPRNDYVFEMLRFIEAFLPKTIMMENVPALAKDGRMDLVKARLKKIGYNNPDVRILNTADYGVPQNRRRMIFLCSRVGKLKVEKSRGDIKLKTVRSAISKLPVPGNTGDPIHDYPEKRSDKIKKRISLIPKNGGSRSDLSEEYELDCHKKTDGFKDVYGRMSWDKPSPTITGGCSNPSKGRFLHPEQNRTITLREAALLQTFRRDYKFSLRSGKQGVAVMIGNALPPKFIRFHARNILNHLSDMDHLSKLKARA